jgi:hypothetical protein
VGLRAAALLPGTPDMVVLAGPAVAGNAINFFVFNASTRAYMGSFSLSDFSDIREFVTYQGSSSVYTAVANSSTNYYYEEGAGGGSVLLYSGVTDYLNCTGCPAFEVVGLLPSEGAYIAVHQGRLYVTTWPGGSLANPVFASLVMGPSITGGPLSGPPVPLVSTPPAANTLPQWTPLWNAYEYEPDPAIATTYAGGALASFGGYLYWGTMHVPLAASIAADEAYYKGHFPLPSTEGENLLAATQRAAAVFRGSNLATTPKIELLYGERDLTKFNVATKSWTTVPNKMHATPEYGSSGMGNPFNNYIWSAAVWKGKLWLGTMNWAYVLNEVTPLIEEELRLNLGPINLSEMGLGTVIPFGANLAYFNNASSPARFDDDSGLGNYLNYGIRNLLPVNNTMYVGTANPMNLMTRSKYKGGWELIQLQLK